MPRSSRTRLRVSVDLPAPDGDERINSSPRRLRHTVTARYSTFCTCSRNCSTTALRSSPIRDSETSFALAQSVFASRPNSCARKSRRRPTDRRRRPAARAPPSTWARKAIQFLADVRARGDQHRLLVQPVRIERRPAVERVAAIIASSRARDRLGLSRRRRFGFADEALDRVDLAGADCRRGPAPSRAAGRLHRLDKARDPGRADRRPERRRGRDRRSSSTFHDAAHREQAVERGAGLTEAGRSTLPTASSKGLAGRRG